MSGNKSFTRHHTLSRCLRDTSRQYTWSMLHRELEQLLPTYGPDHKVLTPQPLRNALAEKIRRKNNIYSPHQQ